MVEIQKRKWLKYKKNKKNGEISPKAKKNKGKFSPKAKKIGVFWGGEGGTEGGGEGGGSGG